MTVAERESVSLGLHEGGQIEVWQHPARYRVVVAGRRWGKTRLGLTWLLSRGIEVGAGRHWYVAPTREDAKDIMWSDLKAACHPAWLAEPPRETDLALHLTNGAELRLWSAEKGDMLRGRALASLVMDEYADMQARIFHEVLLPSLADYAAPALFIGTPKSFNHFHDLYLRGQDASRPDWASWQFKSVGNPTLDPLVVEAARADMDERTYRQEWEASFEAVAGRAYYAFHRGSNVAPVRLEPQDPVALFFDFNVQPSSAGIGQVQGDRACVWRVSQLAHRGGEATRASALAIRRFLDEARHTGEIGIYGDATGRAAKTTGPADHAIIREMFPGAHWRIPSANPHERDRVASVNAQCLTVDGRRRLVVDPSAEPLIADLEQVIYGDNGELDKRSNPMLTHISDALGYWIAREWPVRKAAPLVATMHAMGVDRAPSAVLAARKRRRRAMAESLGIEV
jgi:hypothetical protein